MTIQRLWKEEGEIGNTVFQAPIQEFTWMDWGKPYILVEGGTNATSACTYKFAVINNTNMVDVRTTGGKLAPLTVRPWHFLLWRLWKHHFIRTFSKSKKKSTMLKISFHLSGWTLHRFMLLRRLREHGHAYIWNIFCVSKITNMISVRNVDIVSELSDTINRR
jgi:hypothetical protein